MDNQTMLEIITETNEAVQAVRQAYDAVPVKPKPEWVRGVCPQCAAPVVGNCYYVGGRGYLIVWECWQSLGKTPTCSYRKVL